MKREPELAGRLVKRLIWRWRRTGWKGTWPRHLC